MIKVCLFFTAENCPHCVRGRNTNGMLVPNSSQKVLYGFQSYDYNFMEKALTGDGATKEQSWFFINLHCNEKNVISEISAFMLDPELKHIKQFIFTPLEKENNIVTGKKIHVLNKSTVLEKYSRPLEELNITWEQTIKNLVPNIETLYRFVTAKPAFLFYDEALREKYKNVDGYQEYFYIKTPGAETREEPPYFPLKRNSNLDSTWDPLYNIKLYTENEKLLVPPKINNYRPLESSSHSARQR